MEAKIKTLEEKLRFLQIIAKDASKELLELQEELSSLKVSFWMIPEHKQQLDEELSDQEDRYFMAVC